jgi:hypothetical protein
MAAAPLSIPVAAPLASATFASLAAAISLAATRRACTGGTGFTAPSVGADVTIALPVHLILARRTDAFFLIGVMELRLHRVIRAGPWVAVIGQGRGRSEYGEYEPRGQCGPKSGFHVICSFFHIQTYNYFYMWQNNGMVLGLGGFPPTQLPARPLQV